MEPEPAPQKSAAALRGEKYRAKKKQQDPQFAEKEAARKRDERKDNKREQQLNELLESGRFPINLVALRKKDGPGLFLKDAPQGCGLIVTGGYDAEKIEIVQAEHDKAEKGRRVVPSGAGPDVWEEDGTKPPGAPAYIYIPPKDVRKMRSFIQNCVTESPMMVCLQCRDQIAPEFSFAAGFNHLHDKHPEQFQRMMERVVAAQQPRRRCKEDHEGMALRHGAGTQKLYCGKCRKLLYKPPKPRKSSVRTSGNGPTEQAA